MILTWETVKRGDVIPVYEDPLTQTRLEGVASVIKVYGRDRYTGADCAVKFEDDDVLVVRRRVLAEPAWLAPGDKPRRGSALVRFVAESVGEILFAGHVLGSHLALRDPAVGLSARRATRGGGPMNTTSRAAWPWAACPPVALLFGASATRWPSPSAVLAAVVLAVLVVAALVAARRAGR